MLWGQCAPRRLRWSTTRWEIMNHHFWSLLFISDQYWSLLITTDHYCTGVRHLLWPEPGGGWDQDSAGSVQQTLSGGGAGGVCSSSWVLGRIWSSPGSVSCCQENCLLQGAVATSGGETRGDTASGSTWEVCQLSCPAATCQVYPGKFWCILPYNTVWHCITLFLFISCSRLRIVTVWRFLWSRKVWISLSASVMWSTMTMSVSKLFSLCQDKLVHQRYL